MKELPSLKIPFWEGMGYFAMSMLYIAGMIGSVAFVLWVCWILAGTFFK